VQKRRKLEVKIPPGVDNGSRLRVPGEGEAGNKGGPQGDLYVDIYVKPHPMFTRQEDDIIMEATISFTQAALGDEIIVPTLDGKAKMKIPGGTQNGHIFRLKGKGFPSLHSSGKGDQLVRIKIEVPTKITERQKQLLQEFAEISGEKARSKSIFEKVKDHI
jgi:molecular chaperone DnaJ